MLASFYARILIALFVTTLIACSDGANEVDPANKSNVPPVTSISPDQIYISHEKDIFLNCRDENLDDSCVETYYYWQSPDPVPYTVDGFKVGEDAQYQDAEKIVVQYFSIDESGAREATRAKTYILDKTASVAQPDQLGGTYNFAIDLVFTCNDPDLTVGEPGSGCSNLYYYVTTVDPQISRPVIGDYTVIDISNGSGVTVSLNDDRWVLFFAEDNAGNRQLVQEYHYTFVNPVENVTNLIATAGDGQVSLSWDAPPAGSNIAGVKVMRTEGIANAPINPDIGIEVVGDSPTPTSRLDLNLVNGLAYHYTAFAYDGNGNFASGTIVSATPASNPPPAEVTIFEPVPGNAKVEFSWVNPTDIDFSHVVLVRNPTQSPASVTDGTEVYNGNGTAATDTGLINTMLYYYRIFTVDFTGVTSLGKGVTVTPVDVPPGNVASLTAIPGDGFVDLSWTNPADTDLMGIKIVRKADSAPTAHDDSTADIILENTNLSVVTYKDATVINNTIYYYAAFAYDQRTPIPNYSAVGKVSSPVEPADVTPPDPVTLLTQTPAAGLVVLTWQNPADADFLGVKVLRREIAFPSPADPNDSTAIIVHDGNAQTVTDDSNGAGLINGTSYYYAVFTYDEVRNYSTGGLITAIPQQDDVTKPTVSTTNPLANDIDVNPTSPVEVTFSEAILNTSVVKGVLTLTTHESFSVNLETPTMPTIDSISFNTTAGQLPLATKITAALGVADPNAITPALGVTDLSGNSLDSQQAVSTDPFIWTFTTADGVWNVNADIIGPVGNVGSTTNLRSTPTNPKIAVDNKNGLVFAVWEQDLASTIYVNRFDPNTPMDASGVVPISFDVVDGINP